MSNTLESTNTSTTPSTTTVTNDATATAPPISDALRRKIERTIAKKTFCTIATTSPAGRPHVAGVVYQSVDSTLWVHTTIGSRKARSIAANGHVGVCIPFRRLPMGPPYTIHFQARAELVAMDDPEVLELLEAGELKKISGHGALDMADASFVKIEPVGTVHSYGPGAKVIELIRDPLNTGAASFRIDADGAQR